MGIALAVGDTRIDCADDHVVVPVIGMTEGLIRNLI